MFLAQGEWPVSLPKFCLNPLLKIARVDSFFSALSQNDLEESRKQVKHQACPWAWPLCMEK